MSAVTTPQAATSPQAAAAWLRERLAPGARLLADSRALRAGDAFFGWPGAAHDGRAHATAALEQGAAACLIEAEGLEAGVDLAGLRERVAAGDPRIAVVPGLKAAAGPIAAAFHGHPGQRLAMLAVTGTNGKTSTACWLAQALDALGSPCGVVGTLGVGRLSDLRSTGLTTPDALSLQAMLAGFADQGLAACAMEASSIGLVEHRMAGAPVHVALFTNLTQDHLDYHGSMAAYWAAKRRLFDWPGLRAAVVNIDDAHGAALADELAGRWTAAGAPALWTVSLANPMARLVAGPLRYADGGLVFEVREGPQDSAPTVELRTTLVGAFNAANLLGVLAALRALGHALPQAVRAAERVTAVPGRLQRVPGSGAEVEVFVDYAHTPDALRQTLAALRPLAAARGGRLGCLFGCGGNRDATKRPVMGAIAAELADAVVLTSDNPRREDPRAILAQIEAGIGERSHVATIEDRAEAIAHALAGARSGDVWLLAGKGHEDVQDVGGVKRPFLDLDHARAALARRGVAA